MESVNRKIAETAEIIEALEQIPVEPSEVNSLLEGLGSAPITEKASVHQLLKRPNMEMELLAQALPSWQRKLANILPDSIEQAEIAVKYESYIQKEQQMAA